MADEMNRGVNSQDYWDRRFEEDWESNNGRSYSRAYANLALELLPDWLTHTINREALRVCDWGCAEGDGTAVLANAFPAAQVVGVDFAGPAIAKAQKYYPHVSFRCENWLDDGPPPEPACDLLFSSHTLEHFGRPWDVLQKLSPYFTRIAVVLVPFQEQDLIPEHDYSFDFSNIRIKQPCDLDLAACSVIDSGHTRDHCWSGRQVLMIFMRPGDSLWGGLTLGDTVVRTSREDRLQHDFQAREKSWAAEREKLSRDLQHTRAAIEQIMGSKSWRITAPLRWAVERLGRGRVARKQGGPPVAEPDGAQDDAELPPPKKQTLPTRLRALRVGAIMDTFPRYRERCGDDRVHALPFAAQPEIHNPILKEPRNGKVCFAGTYSFRHKSYDELGLKKAQCREHSGAVFQLGDKGGLWPMK